MKNKSYIKIWKYFLTMSLSFGFGMSFVHGIKIGIIEGIFFGAAMTALYLYSAKKQNTSKTQTTEHTRVEIITIKSPKLIIYIVGIGFFFFLAGAVGSFYVFKGPQQIFMMLAFLGIMLTQVWGLYGSLTSYTIDTVNIHRISKFPFLKSIRVYKLADIKSVDISKMSQAVKVRFNDSVCTIYCYDNSMQSLPAYEGDVPIQLEKLYMLKQEIERRVEIAVAIKTRN